MRPIGLTQADIEKIANFDQDDSEDKENDEEDQEGAVNFEIIIEETLQSVIESGEMIRKSGDENENNEVVIQPALEKIDLQSLKLSECDTRWKAKVCSNEVKQPIEQFTQFFADEVWHMICDETNH